MSYYRIQNGWTSGPICSNKTLICSEEGRVETNVTIRARDSTRMKFVWSRRGDSREIHPWTQNLFFQLFQLWLLEKARGVTGSLCTDTVQSRRNIRRRWGLGRANGKFHWKQDPLPCQLAAVKICPERLMSKHVHRNERERNRNWEKRGIYVAKEF